MNPFDEWWLQWRGIAMATEIDPLCAAQGAWFAAKMESDKELSRLRAENAELRAEAERFRKLTNLVLELADAIDGAAYDVGGHRPQADILQEAIALADWAEN